MQKIIVEAKDDRLSVPSEYNRQMLRRMVKVEGVKFFDLVPRIKGSKSQQRYLEGAVIPAYGFFQYGLDPRRPENVQLAREAFKLDFHSQVVKDRYGNPQRVPLSLKGQHRLALDKYTAHAVENGLPIPNEALFKKWKNEFSMEFRWAHYWDFLDYLGLDCDAMPSEEALRKAYE